MGFRIGSVAQAERDVGAGVFWRVGGGGNELANIEAFFACEVDHLMARRLIFSHFDGFDGVEHGVVEEEAESARICVEHLGHALAIGQKPDGDAGAGMALDGVEDRNEAPL